MAVCLGYFMIILDTTIVTVALPAMRRDLHTGVSGLQWVVDGYTLLFATLLLAGGALGDRCGARRVFQLGQLLFVAASAACAVAPTVVVLVLARLLQGIGAALAVPASLALLRVTFEDVEDRARVVGIWGGIAGVAAAGGPVVGGILVSAVSWRAVFLVNVPIGLAGIALTARHVAAPEGRPRGLDPVAQVVAITALAALTVSLIEGERAGWKSASVLTGFAVFLVGNASFVALERHSRDPMLPLALFRDSTFAGATLVGILINLGFYGELFVLNLYFQQVLGYSPVRAGVALLPQMAMAFIASPLSGRFTARVGGPRVTMLAGLCLGGAGLLGLIVSDVHTPYAMLVVPLLAAGFGMAFTMPAATTAVVEAAPVERAGLASGVINAARQVGGVVGVAVLGDLVRAGSFVTGLHVAMAVAGVSFLSGAVATAFMVRA